MQPYFFPYIGYFKLVNAVDKFVFYDDVNYIKNGWINRNKILLLDESKYITIPLNSASSFEKINKIKTQISENWPEKILSTLHKSYAKAPYYRNVKDIISKVIKLEENSISKISQKSIVSVMEYLEIEKHFFTSSNKYKNQNLKSVERILDICKIENATQYWNLPGGKDLYSHEIFKKNGIELKFIDSKTIPYQQITSEFQPNLSIIDALMFNDPKTVKKMISLDDLP